MSNPQAPSSTLRLGGNRSKIDHDSVVVNPVMSATLIDMGFSKFKSNRALQMVNNVSIDAAIQYIYDHFNELDQEELITGGDTSSDTLSSTTTTTSSPTIPTRSEINTSSNDTSSPLMAGIPAIHHNPNKLKGDSIENKLAFAERERLKEQERLKKEKMEEKKRIKALKEQMKREKEEKMSKQQTGGAIVPSTATTTTTTTTSASTSTPSDQSNALIQVRLPSGTTEKVQLTANDNLNGLYAAISSQLDPNEAYSILTTFPRKEFFAEDWNQTTLKQAGLVPKGSVIVQLTKNKGMIIKASTTMPTTTTPTITPPSGHMSDDSDDENGGTISSSGSGRILGSSSQVIPEESALRTILNSSVNFNKDSYTLLLCEKQWILSKLESSSDDSQHVVYRHLGDSHLTGSSLNECVLYSALGHVSMSSNGETMVGTWRFTQQHGGICIEITCQNMVQIMLIESLTNECLILKRFDK
ncbi:hypothetical protein C9374_001980 [Naegleria lovaniensis]|uniref:UBX domain-containing protein n=1 Tax=Naegleria lovaniensis TaxID=51637 RepID=A0AA88GQA9_NAELO|nr:uncharacterized protein C9374_001980 [Naegleria lovaniensis]KAG2386945.1 hypothetical protein C9374_001980 [Naegleria lovaniensis]